LATGLTIAGAVFCLSFTRLPLFQPLGVPCGVGMLVALAVALTLFPAIIAVGSRFGLFDPKRVIRVRRWRRVGTAIVRWPAPIFVAACAVALRMAKENCHWRLSGAAQSLYYQTSCWKET
jgi:RND superfamily putative drug exporter